MKPLFQTTLAALAALGLAAPVHAQGLAIDFGDDSGSWANDGECDDPRFEGQGMAGIVMVDDIMKDASDCRAGLEAGLIAFMGVAPDGMIDFGTDTGAFAGDGECDDLRFTGPGMSSFLVADMRMGDATDCQAQFMAGGVTLNGASADGSATIAPSEGGGNGGGFLGGLGALLGGAAADPGAGGNSQGGSNSQGGNSQGGGGGAFTVDFGADSGDWTNDGECDDPRFVGQGMASILVFDDLKADATDCRVLYEAGSITLNGVSADGTVDFGTDNGDWSQNGECDDMRFEGPGMTSTILIYADIMADASDCRAAFQAGTVQLR